ncbi:tetratricopeptide repeat protein [Caldimonas sp. KR1-144]|uniref:tetratricopeptide repeat protein n=1 Tax=Caldimonas sp. KR1-144 TaxID=3400911 RepID=UPI003C069792
MAKCRPFLTLLLCGLACMPLAAQTAPASPIDDDEPAIGTALDAETFYEVLVGEIALRSGEPGAAYETLLDAARRMRDERLFQRATEIALQARAGDQALAAARAWRRALPQSMEAARYEIQLLSALERVGETAEPLRALLALVPPAERPGAILSLPRSFARAGDRKQVRSVMEQVLLPYAQAKVAGEPPAAAVAAWASLARVRAAAGDGAAAVEALQQAQALDAGSEGPALVALELMPTQPAAESMVQSYLAIDGTPLAKRSAVRLMYARTLAGQQRYAEALPQMETVTRDAPGLADAWLALGALRLELKQPQPAEQALRTYLERLAQAPAGEAAQSSGDDDGSLAQRQTQAYLLLAQAAEQRRDYAGAEAWLAKVDGSQALAVQVRRASLLAQQGKLDAARALVRQVPERNPEDARAKVLAEAQLLRDAKAWAPAREVLAAGNERFKDDVDLLYEQAMVDEKLDRLPEMEALLRRVIALRPDHHHAYNALGYSLADRNQRLPEARALILKALEISPGEPFLVDSLGWVEYRMGNREEALKWLRQAYRARPDPEIAAHLGEVLWVNGERDEARRVWREGRGRDAGNEVLLETLARLKVEL